MTKKKWSEKDEERIPRRKCLVPNAAEVSKTKITFGNQTSLVKSARAVSVESWGLKDLNKLQKGGTKTKCRPLFEEIRMRTIRGTQL